MKVRITITVSETREVSFSDYDLEDDDSTEQDLLECIEADINDDYTDFIADNYNGCLVEKIKEEEGEKP